MTVPAVHAEAAPATRPDDWATDQEVRWCPGCGDYAILKAVQRTLADVGAQPENTVFVSGIGCSSRFPYYMETYGFHTIHGRAPAIATGVKLANPDLDIWIITGDGDGLSIGGNHMLHLLRRNLDCQLLLFNNEIYGLTKGQYSPTSRVGTRSSSSPAGSLDNPVSPCGFALGAGGRFVARSIDTAQKHLAAMLARAYRHKGAGFVEIFQNCIVYNDGVFANFTDKKSAAERQLILEHGQPMLFANGTKGIALDPEILRLTVVDTEGAPERALVHDETNRAVAHMLADLHGADFPVPIGVLYCDPAPTFDDAIAADRAAAGSDDDFAALLRRGQTWTVGRTAGVG